MKIKCSNKTCPYRVHAECRSHYNIVHIDKNGCCGEHLKAKIWIDNFVKKWMKLNSCVVYKDMKNGWAERIGVDAADLIQAGALRLMGVGRRLYRTRHMPFNRNMEAYLTTVITFGIKDFLLSEERQGAGSSEYNDDVIANHVFAEQKILISGKTIKRLVAWRGGEDYYVEINEEVDKKLNGTRLYASTVSASVLSPYARFHWKGIHLYLHRYVWELVMNSSITGQINFRDGNYKNCVITNLEDRDARSERLSRYRNGHSYIYERRNGKHQAYLPDGSCLGTFKNLEDAKEAQKRKNFVPHMVERVKCA